MHKGGRVEPNVRATVQEIYQGLIVTSQNSWPNLKFDALAINDIAARFLSAGFYYKTFMWPPRFWEALYEPIIRRAAGLGRLDSKTDDDNYDQNFLLRSFDYWRWSIWIAVRLTNGKSRPGCNTGR